MRAFKYILIVFFSFWSYVLNSQETYYYKYVKSSLSTQKDLEAKGGQFITFVKDKCYESDSEGFSVNNGVLKYQNTEKDISNYYGDAYWGKCYFRFNKDKTKLNVVLDDNSILVYERANPPHGVTTCSLIKEKENSSGNSTNYYYNNQIITSTIPYNTQPAGMNNTNTAPASGTSNHFEHAEYGYKDCKHCHGTGTCQTCNGKGWYIGGVGLEKLPCPNCASNHNGKCAICSGTGKVYGRLN